MEYENLADDTFSFICKLDQNQNLSVYQTYLCKLIFWVCFNGLKANTIKRYLLIPLLKDEQFQISNSLIKSSKLKKGIRVDIDLFNNGYMKILLKIDKHRRETKIF